MPINPDFLANLKRALADSGDSARAVAGRMGVSETAVSYWRSGTGPPTKENAEKLAKALKVPIAQFWLPDEPVGASGQARLAHLEDLARRMIDLANEAERVMAGEASPYRPPPMAPLKKPDHKGKATPKRGRASGE